MILDRVVDIARLQKDSTNTNKESYVNYTPLAATSCNIQPASPEDTVMANGLFGQTYTCFTTASGILEGDRITVRETGEVLRVKGKTNWMSPDLISHIELLLTEFETAE